MRFETREAVRKRLEAKLAKGRPYHPASWNPSDGRPARVWKVPTPANSASTQTINEGNDPSISPFGPPAEPPPIITDDPDEERPAYWDKLMSKNLRHWLENTNATSTNINLDRVKLSGYTWGTTKTSFEMTYADEDFAMVRMFSVNIPEDAEIEPLEPEAREWCVFEIQSTFGALKDEQDACLLLAVPCCALANSQGHDEMVEEDGEISCVTLHDYQWNEEDSIPSVQIKGKNVPEELEKFMDACRRGRGIMEFMTVKVYDFEKLEADEGAD